MSKRLNEHNLESKGEIIKGIVDEDLILNFANNLIENENNIDEKEIINWSTNRLPNQLLMNFVENLSQFVQIPIFDLSENQIMTEMTLLKEQLKELDNKLRVVKDELTDVKKKNNDLSEIIVNLEGRLKLNGIEQEK